MVNYEKEQARLEKLMREEFENKNEGDELETDDVDDLHEEDHRDLILNFFAGLAMCSPVRGNVRLSPVELCDDNEKYRCYDCNVNFTSESYLLGHLLHHIRQPAILIRRLQAPIKITLKSRSRNNFEIINSPTSTAYMFTSEYLAEESHASTGTDNSEVNTEDSGTFSAEHLEEDHEMLDKMLESASSSISSNFEAPIPESTSLSQGQLTDGNLPCVITEFNGADSQQNIPQIPTPPESVSPTEYPKIRIKTTGLLKERLKITEVTDDVNTSVEYRGPDIVELTNNSNNENNATSSNYWSSCIDDPLKLQDSDRNDSTLLSSFLSNNNDQAKAFGITTDSEFISLDRLDDRNRNALQVYNPTTSSASTSSLDNLTGLPMQQLAEQVSRLQPSGSGTAMHQQNVLINIQQFPQAPPQSPHNYQHPPMYPPHPPHPRLPTQPPPLYQPYQYQPTPLYYPPNSNYPPAPHMPPPPPPQMQQSNQQMSQQSIVTHGPQQSMPPPQRPQFRQAIPPRAPAPRQYNQQPRGPTPRGPMIQRQRAPMMRPRGMGTAVRSPRPRVPINPPQMNGNTQNQPPNNQQRVIKRNSDHIQNIQVKKKRMDVLVPDKNDDADCEVIAVQPKNTDGGLPQIQSVEGGTTDPSDNVMHLSDSITLSVRNPPPKPPSPKKSDAKDVANILATRGITVTASPKLKEKSKESPTPSIAINLNSAVSIIPTAKPPNAPLSPKSAGNDPKLPTVDLTDDSVPEQIQNNRTQQSSPSPPLSPQQQKNGRGALPFKCDLCPAQYPTLGGVNKHRQSYHKTGSPCDIGIPLVDLKQPGVLQKLSNLGITNFIPMPSSTPDGQFALPVVTLNVAKNTAVCNLHALGASSLLTLGPVRSLPKPHANTKP
ncbi:hypothetical protein FQA39_LY09197 [Lamprigera yunnana]|nr:hypothetical protein FQA39_LY09197 [Lamprigera yunnana]